MIEKHMINLTLCVAVTIGPDCDGGKEVRSVDFADIQDGIGIDIGDFINPNSKGKESVKQAILDRIPEVILLGYYKEMREIDRLYGR